MRALSGALRCPNSGRDLPARNPTRVTLRASVVRDTMVSTVGVRRVRWSTREGGYAVTLEPSRRFAPIVPGRLWSGRLECFAARLWLHCGNGNAPRGRSYRRRADGPGNGHQRQSSSSAERSRDRPGARGHLAPSGGGESHRWGGLLARPFAQPRRQARAETLASRTVRSVWLQYRVAFRGPEAGAVADTHRQPLRARLPYRANGRHANLATRH